MSEQDSAQILARLDAIERRSEANIQRLFERLDAMAEQGHEVRIAAIEKRLDGFWGKVIGIVSALVAGLGLLWNLIRGADK